MNSITLTDQEFAALRRLDAAWDRLSTPEALLALRLLLGEERCRLYIDAVAARKKLQLRIEGDGDCMTFLA